MDILNCDFKGGLSVEVSQIYIEKLINPQLVNA